MLRERPALEIFLKWGGGHVYVRSILQQLTTVYRSITSPLEAPLTTFSPCQRSRIPPYTTLPQSRGVATRVSDVGVIQFQVFDSGKIIPPQTIPGLVHELFDKV